MLKIDYLYKELYYHLKQNYRLAGSLEYADFAAGIRTKNPILTTTIMNSKPKMVLWAVCLFAIMLFPLSGMAQQEITVSETNIDEVLEPGQAMTVNVTITNDGDAPLTWSTTLEDVYGRGPGVVFSKANFANWIIPSNQDRISNNVWLARADNKSIFNAKSETTSDDNSPSDTEWASGGLNDGGSFDTFKNMHGGDPQSLVGNTATLHAISDDDYYEVDFSSWTGGNNGGGFGYTRHQMYEYLSFNSVTSGTLAPAEQVVLTIELSALDIESATYSGSLTITSDDADEGTIVIPIGLEVMESATFELSSTSFSQTVNTGDAPATQMLTISNNGASALNWSSNETSTRPRGMSGVTLNNYSGTVASGESEVVEISFSDDGNPEGTYEWPLALFSNDPDNDVEIVTISLEIIGEALIDYDLLDPFGNTFVGTTSNQTLTIYNEGTADLEVLDIVSSAPQFVATSTQFTIAPDESIEVTVLFSPDAPGSITGDLTITSNDTETSTAVVAVEGEAVSPPALEVTPLSFNESLSTDDSPLARSVTISNTGGSPLEWDFNFESLRVRDESSTTAFAKASSADETLPENQDRITENVWITRENNDGVFNAFEESEYSESTNTIEWALGRTEDVSPEDYTSFKDALDYNLSGRTTESVLSLHLIESNRYFDVEFDVWEPGRSGGAFSYTRTEVVSWLSSEEANDPIAAGESLTFDFEVDASNLVAGNFDGTIDISSNDPIESNLSVNVNLTVSGTPDISSTELTPSGQEEIVGATGTFYVPITNDGTADLEVSSASISGSVFTLSESTFIVPAKSVYDLEVSFTPVGVESYSESLTIASNDPVLSSIVITLEGDGLATPGIQFSTTTFSETLEAGTQSTGLQLTITNGGSGSLDWEVSSTFFEKENFADVNLPENQDKIYEDVIMSRYSSGGVTNIADDRGSVLYSDGPTSTRSVENGDYYSSMTSIGDLSSTEGSTWSIYLSDYDEYYDLFFDTWVSGSGSGNGGGGGVAYTRRSAIPWLNINAFSGSSLGFEGTSVINVTFDASDLNAGNYTFSYDIISNDPANPITTITFNLEVTGTPNLSVSEGSSLNFGDQFVSTTSSEGELWIQNTGSAPLEVTNITFDDPAFTVATNTATIQPDETAILELSFAPGAEQAYNATGTITSNDPESPATFSISGTGIAQPNVSIDISSITAELLSGGVLEESFTITNNSANSASWSIEKIAVAGTDEVIFEKENFADWTLAENQDRVSESLWITRADDRGLFNAAIETEYTNGDRDERIAIVVEDPGNDPFDASPHGTLWAYGRTMNENRYESWRSASDGNAADLPGKILSMWDVVEDKYYDVEFLSWTSGGGCCGNPSMGGGFSYRRYESLTWLNNFSDTEGTLDAESSQEVTFDVNAEGVSAGEYEAVLTISDGLNTADITVSLTVLGLPEIFADDEAVDFESVFIGLESTKELAIGNVGLADLEISNISSDNSAFTVSNVPSTIGIGGYGFFEVTFAPTEAISYNAVLTITSNDGTTSNLTIDLSGSGVNPPVLGVDETSLDETLFFGASSSQTFTISNTGDSDLEWNLGLSGGTVVFSRPDNVDWTLAENQDRIADDVWITRGSSRGIFNIAKEEEFNRNTDESPVGTLWAYGATGEGGERGGEGPCCLIDRVAEAVSENYSDWRDVVGGNPSSENTYSMYLTDYDSYYDVVFTYWAQGNDDGQGSTGGFTYERTPAFYEYEAVSFSATEGVVEPGKSQEVTVFFNPAGTFDGRFELPLQVESNDPNGPAEIPLTLNVNGIITVNPIEDQLEIEGFGASAIDISNLFADAQDDPLNFIVSSSQEGIVSAAESGGTLTVTEVGVGTAVISVTAEDGKGSSDSFEFDFRVNSIPVINNGLADQSLENGFGTFITSIDGVFGDADENDELTVEVSTSASGVVDASLSGDVLTLTEVGPGTVDVILTANDGFGGEVSDAFEVFVNKINQTITFDALSAVPENIGTVELTATASSGLAVSYSSSNTAVATVSGSTLTILSDGQTTITASQAGDAEYNAATSVDQSLTVEAVLSASDLESIEIYPNPVEDFLSISNASTTKIEIYHLDGKLVLTQEVTDKANLSDLDEGVYLIKLKDKDDNELYKGRLVKN